MVFLHFLSPLCGIADSLVLLQCLKAHFLTAHGSSGHRLFMYAFMITSKVMCDDTYVNKLRGIMAQGVQFEGDQPDGVRDVQLLRVGVDSRCNDTEEFRDDGTEKL